MTYMLRDGLVEVGNRYLRTAINISVKDMRLLTSCQNNYTNMYGDTVISSNIIKMYPVFGYY
jgi:uncharacterized protein (UPF0333 family)